MNIRPFIKWPGGKTAELPFIIPALQCQGRYFEPFVGGGAVLLSIDPSVQAIAGDASRALIGVYEGLKTQEAEFLSVARSIAETRERLSLLKGLDAWRDDFNDCEGLLGALEDRRLRETVLPAIRKAAGIKERWMCLKNVTPADSIFESAIQSGFYNAIRSRMNVMEDGPVRSVYFWFVREYAYGGMFKPTVTGNECVAYGGASYNGRQFSSRLVQGLHPDMKARLSSTVFETGDFQDVLDSHRPCSGDTVFLDPPYDRGFSNYDRNPFGPEDHRRLADWVTRSPARCVIVVASTEQSEDIYGSIPGSDVIRFNLRYRQGIKGRFNQQATHLMVVRPAMELRHVA